MCAAPLANPLYLCDSPQFLLRQRARGSRALVSEHVGSVTCDCAKCRQASLARVQKEGLCPWVPAPTFTGDVAQLDLAVGDALGSTPGRLERKLTGQKAAPEGSQKQTIQRDFAWLLRVLFELAELEVQTTAMPSFLEDLVKGRPSSKSTANLGPFGVGVKIPETVILEKGKPKRRYSLDGKGAPEVTRMKTSAELLRVLREFVRKAAHQVGRKTHAGQAQPQAATWDPRQASSYPQSQPGLLTQSASEPALATVKAPSSAANPHRASTSRGSGREGRIPPLALAAGNGSHSLLEAAVLYYVDGAVRCMTSGEAVTQMAGVSKLPREFWQHICMLQVPVMSSKVGKQTRYITYNFDVRGNMFQPQAQQPLSIHRRAEHVAGFSALEPNQASGVASSNEANRVAAVPQRINAKLAQRKRGEVGAGIEIVSGQLEFVLDEADGTLWLVNASKLRCARRAEEKAEDQGLQSEDEGIRYFVEEEFDSLMRTQEVRFENMKKRFNMSGPPGGMTASPSMSAADRLAGVTVPDELNKYCEAEEEMLRYYDEEVKPEVFRRLPQFTHVDGTAVQSQRAVGLSVWFRRWVVACKGRKWKQIKVIEAMMAASNLPHWRRRADDD
mmetsp:Transcript_75584/g.179603  ORF Transcript_75584/g.179603 Transcript_75584/m.179603 type:complete len:615 (-) Transcript_75584:104-1948(-)